MAMTEKKTVDMFIREVPLDVWENVDRLCRRVGIKRRKFIEHALSFFQEGDGQKAWEEGAERAREAEARIDQIRNSVKQFKNIIALKKEIEKISSDIDVMGNEDTEMKMLLELKKLESDLDELIKKDVPDHNIPDDFEKRRKMGLPERYCGWERMAISKDFDRGF